VRLYNALEIRSLMRPVAKWFAFRHPTAAQPDLRAARQTVGLSFLIHDLYFAIDEQRAVIHDRYFNVRHSILRSPRVELILLDLFRSA
jgi:hypothetical protein